MRCSVCGNDTDVFECNHRGSNRLYICNSCCSHNQNYKTCNTTCEKYKDENMVFTQPIGMEMTSVHDGKTMSFIQDLFLPNVYNQFAIEVDKLQINLLSLNYIEVDFEFRVVSKNAFEDEIFLRDKWKRAAKGIEESELVPLFQVYSSENSKVLLLPYTFSIDNRQHEEFDLSANHYCTWMPFTSSNNGYIDTKDMPEFQSDSIVGPIINGERYFGRNTTVWSKIRLGKSCKMSISIEYMKVVVDKEKERINLPLGIFFPFPFVNMHNYSIYTTDELVLQEESCDRLLVPKQTNEKRLFLTPIESNQGVLEIGGYVEHNLGEVEKQFHYDRYAILHHTFVVKLEQGFDIYVQKSKYPLLTGVYHAMNKLYRDVFAPVILTITNTEATIRRITVVSKIKGLSRKFEKHYSIKPYDVCSIPISPLLNKDKISSLCEITEMSIDINVYERNERIFSETKSLEIHPPESFIFNLELNKDEWKVYLYQLLACYCTPHTKDIENIISKASRKSGRILGVLSHNYDVIMKEIESIYNVISDDIRYVTRSFNFKTDKNYKTQRISLPSTTLQLKSGNCIDLSLLLASTFEACKYEIDIIVLPGHAIVAVKVTGTWIYIESTMLGYRPFTEAVQKGNEVFYHNFESRSVAKNNESKIVSIELARRYGILPFE